MSKVYATQDYLRIALSHDEDISDTVTSAIIKYIDPNNESGYWNAQYDSVNKIVYYDLNPGSPLGISGKWTVWSVLYFADTRVLPGTPCTFMIYDEGEDGCPNGNCY